MTRLPACIVPRPSSACWPAGAPALARAGGKLMGLLPTPDATSRGPTSEIRQMRKLDRAGLQAMLGPIDKVIGLK